ASHPKASALTYKNKTLSYAELWQQICGMAAQLIGVGLEREQRVAVFLEKRIETVVAIFGTSAAGGTFVPINPLLRPHQVAHIIADCGARVLVTSSERLDLLGNVMNACPSIEHILLVDAGPETKSKMGHEIHLWPQSPDSVNPSTMRNGIDLDMAAIL